MYILYLGYLRSLLPPLPHLQEELFHPERINLDKTAVLLAMHPCQNPN
jgi:hypothetical protein